VLVFVARFRQIAGTTRELGLAAFVVMSAVVMVSITPETRHLIAFLPWIVVLAVHATRDAWTPRALGIYVALTVVWSKLWWSIGYERYHDSFRFPDQRYWMHLGPWSTDLPFVIHGAAAVVTAVVLAWVLGGPARARPTGEFS